MNEKKPPRFGLDELARQLAESVPPNLRAFGQDLERNFKALLHTGLERTRTKLEQMEARLADLEKR